MIAIAILVALLFFYQYFFSYSFSLLGNSLSRDKTTYIENKQREKKQPTKFGGTNN